MLSTRKTSLVVAVFLYSASCLYAENSPSTAAPTAPSAAPTQTEQTQQPASQSISPDSTNQQQQPDEQQANEQRSWCSCLKDITLKKVAFVVGGCGFAVYACKKLYDLMCTPTRYAPSARPVAPAHTSTSDEQEDPAIVIEALSDEQRRILHAFAAALEAADIAGLYAFNFDDFPFEWRLALAWTQMRVIALYESGIDAATLAVHRQHLVEGLREMIQVFDGLAQEKDEVTTADVVVPTPAEDSALEVVREDNIVVSEELVTDVAA